YAGAGVGAVATQSYANPVYGPDGLAAMAAGRSAAEAIEAVTSVDEQRALRQVGMVDAAGRAATFTGDECFDWAGGVTGDGYACQGNILTGPDVVRDMAAAYEAASGTLAERLLVALAAGDAAGGDQRGRQAAGVYVVRAGGGYLGGSDVAVDLRVDDHPDPVTELRRLYGIHRLLFPGPGELDFIDVDDDLAGELRTALRSRGYDPGEGPGYDRALSSALFVFAGTENLEARWSDEARIDRAVLDFLRN
ncbi:MAG: DUF1028 domain-containing protein, partial [Acidimicrobiia bacterium]|nr:DUF1028 domain-containing protein [Acidimicrobiia bacterium]